MTALAAGGIRTLDDATRFLSGLSASPTPELRAGAGMERARALLAAIGDPQDELRAVHVAGTAGKGSVVAFVANILRSHGLSVGAHLSPHIGSVAERFQLDGRPVAPEVVARELDRLAEPVRAMTTSAHGRPTYFEVLNALAFRLFADERVDYAVVETGIGGLHDATNTLNRSDKLAVVTAIGLDHTRVLGTTLAEIARQKAGILPRDGSAIAIMSEVAEVNRILAEEAARRCCALELMDPAATVHDIVRRGRGGWTFSYTGSHRLTQLQPGLEGRHQIENAALALRAVEQLATRDGWMLCPDAVRHGLSRTALPGRFERRTWRTQELVLDVAHNPVKLASLVSGLEDAFPGRRFVWVLALKQDKDVRGALEVIAPVAATVVATQFAAPGGDHPLQSSLPAPLLAQAARRAGTPSVLIAPDPHAALEQAIGLSPAAQPVVVAGSFQLLAAISASVTP